MRLIPGVAVSSSVIYTIDTNHDGTFSEAEQTEYARHVLNDLSFALDETRLTPQLVSSTFPRPGQLRDGLGEIRLSFIADLPQSDLHHHTLILDNHD